ncbi:TonB-dependent receptor, partial [Parabacteroides sp. OttesenSCG-928-N08]|nr:TonB-dependent receptor [Parabacteroides sp. OttesenSCG-928-N08]
MMMITKISLLMFVCTLLFIVPDAFAQGRSLTVSGTVKEAATGEELIGAGISVKGTATGTVSDAYGRYSLSLPPGRYTLIVSYIGYIAREYPLTLDAQNQSLHITLDEDNRQLSEVVVSAEGHNAHISRLDMGTERLTVKAIKAMPALMGEVDLIKAIQMLPGVQSTAEGTSGFSVRGGSHDQNLILLDEATVYNASHLMGFFSVFNNDAIKDVVLYKGDIPANFGGRLSSLLDIRSKEGNNQRYAATGGIGIISSRLTVEGPIAGDKLSFLASARRTYADIFLKLLPDDNDASGSSLYFYDFNAKLNYRINERNRVYLAGYFGKDHFGTSFAGMSFGNKTLSARWNHTFSPKLFANFSLIASSYDYYMLIDMDDQLDQDWKSKMQDIGFKADFSYYPNPRHHVRFGYNIIHHTFLPGEGGGLGENPVVQRFGVPRQYGAEQALYLTDEASAGDRIKLKYGLRFSLYHNIANGEEITYLDHYQPVRTETPTKGTIYNTYHQLEPRLGIAYILADDRSLKASYSRTAQYIQMASNSAAGSPLDVWFQSSHNVKPQLSDQFSVGYFRNFSGNLYEASAEL